MARPASRVSTHPHVHPDCPVCGRPLPRVVVDCDGRSAPVAGVQQIVDLSVRVQQLDAAWWAAARAEHPRCVPAAGLP